jgi:hypothetical protein
LLAFSCFACHELLSDEVEATWDIAREKTNEGDNERCWIIFVGKTSVSTMNLLDKQRHQLKISAAAATTNIEREREREENIEHMFFIFTNEPFGSLKRIGTEVARASILTMSKTKQRRLIDGKSKSMVWLLPAVNAK